ncbi:MAG: hypothetical protein AABY22_35640 [Nanoarchaeota archaeon]
MSHLSRQLDREVAERNAKPLPEAKFVRDGHIVRNVETGNIEFTGLVGKDVPSISAAKRWVRARKFKQYELRRAV